MSYTGNCQAVEPNFFLNYSGYSFPCKQCSDSEYLSTDDLSYVCKSRLKSDPESANCKTFSLTSETCTTCMDNFYLNKAGTGCTAYPTGAYGCVEYDNTLKCTKCDDDHYLLNGACTKVATPEPVANCQLYSNETTCQ